MAQYRVDVMVLPADRPWNQESQYALYRNDRLVEVGRCPEDPHGLWGAIMGKTVAKFHATFHRDQLVPNDIEVRNVVDGPLLDVSAPPLVGR